MNRPLYFSTCFALVVIASILPVMSATAGPSIRTDDDENGRLHFPIVRGNRNSNPAKAIDSAGLDTEILSHSDIDNDSFAENKTSSPAPSNPPSISPMPTAMGGHNTTTVSPAPSLSSPPTSAGGVPSAPPSISNPPTTTNHTHPPSISPVPSAPPTPDNDNEKGGLSFFQKFVKAVTWTIVALVTALAFGWIVSNHRRILPLLGELWLWIRTTDWLRFVMNVASRTREACSGLYHRLRFGRWSFRGLGGRDYDTVPLNEIVFDPHDSGDPTELLLQRER